MMMKVQKYIADLLSEHDCVIVPGLGGFLGSYVPAQIHPVYHTFQPPSKKILFNINLRQNDGLLANRIVQEEKISFDEASRQVARFAQEVLYAMKTKRTFMFPRVGRLLTGKEGNIQFEQDSRTNHLDDSFGLQPFFTSPVKSGGPVSVHQRNEISHTSTSELVRRALPRPLRWAAILAIPVAAAIMLSLAGYDSVKSGSWNTANLFSSLVPFSKPEPTAQLPANSHQYTDTGVMEEPGSKPVSSLDQQGYAPPPAPSEPMVTDHPTDNTPEPVVKPRISKDNGVKYCVIVGAFKVHENATGWVTELKRKGTDARILDRSSGGLYRVTSGVFDSHQEAHERLNYMKAHGIPGAWILETNF